MKYTIAVEAKEAVEKKLARIQKKGEKYGCSFGYKIGEVYVKSVPVWVHENGKDRKVGNAHVEVCDLEISSESLVTCGCDKVLAKIEHFQNGNIVTTFENEDAKPEWSMIRPHCDHCGTNRVKTVTFMVRKQGGEVRQVGRSCLHDYTGIDPQMIGIWNELSDICYDADAEKYFDSERIGGSKLISVQKALALSMDIISDQGYIKVGFERANKTLLADLVRGNVFPTTQNYEKAGDMISFLSNLTQEEAFRYNLANEKVWAVSGWCKPSHLGYIAYAPIAIQKVLKRIEEEKASEERRKSESETSDYVGQIGEKIQIELKEHILITSWESTYGMTWLYKFIDTKGNVFIWYASSPISKDSYTKVKGTVKAHNVRDDVKQTVLTRCKVA